MADLKRQSGTLGGKASGPGSSANAGSINPLSLEAALVGAIGARVRLTTTLSNTLEGTLFVADPITNLIAINTAPPPPTPSSSNANSTIQPGDYHVIPVSQISAFKILPFGDASNTKESSFETAFPKIGNVNLIAAKQREEAAVRRLQENERRLGKGVSREAQEIFDALSKTLPSRWYETRIIVLDTVMIYPPYEVENCKAEKDSNTLQRVKMVLGEERKKLADRMGRKGG
ncbi:hypothetical protein GP486_006605 [Trichoglossum hirsutum]|uniref:AD domain-containing protein n=1 Tax=Trichoglossum hirsutum TaxID=265104 RepID=A0A9P8L5G5_9PEZI|nr:hypothetical protein GP486_006605 [Trichoglossum hirsutum]